MIDVLKLHSLFDTIDKWANFTFINLYERCEVYNSWQSMILQSMIPWMLIVI